MKLRQLFIFFIGIVFVNCAHESLYDKYGRLYRPHIGNANYILNDKLYNCFPYADSSNLFPETFYLTMLYYNESHFIEGQLLFSGLPLKSGRYEFTSADFRSGEPSCNFFIALVDPDLPDFIYQFDTMLNFSWIDIEFDSLNRDISGSFNIHLKNTYSYINDPMYPDTINLVGNYATQINYKE